MQVFHTSFNWWFFTKVWLTASLPRFPRLSILADFNSAGWSCPRSQIFSSSSLFSTFCNKGSNYWALRQQIWVDMGVMAMKGYSILLRASELEPYHQMQFSFLPKTPPFGRSYPFAGGLTGCWSNWVDFFRIRTLDINISNLLRYDTRPYE